MADAKESFPSKEILKKMQTKIEIQDKFLEKHMLRLKFVRK